MLLTSSKLEKAHGCALGVSQVAGPTSKLPASGESNDAIQYAAQVLPAHVAVKSDIREIA